MNESITGRCAGSDEEDRPCRPTEHILLCGRRRSARSAMIRALLRDVTAPVFGYETLTMGTRADGYHEIYLYPYGTKEPRKREENHAADCNTTERVIHKEVFDTLGVELLRQPVRGILVMDEIGFMESGAEAFCRAVLERLDGDVPVLAAVRTGMETDFLRQVMRHKKARCIEMRPERFAEVEEQLRPIIRAWNDSIMENRESCESTSN